LFVRDLFSQYMLQILQAIHISGLETELFQYGGILADLVLPAGRTAPFFL